jgi:hypothetical protein
MNACFKRGGRKGFRKGAQRKNFAFSAQTSAPFALNLRLIRVNSCSFVVSNSLVR